MSVWTSVQEIIEEEFENEEETGAAEETEQINLFKTGRIKKRFWTIM